MTLEDIARIADVFYIGGTKVGAMFGEAVVFIFWNLMDSHVLKLEGPACDFTIEAWAKRAYLVQEDRRTHEVKRYEIMNCTYRELSGKISKKHAPEETPSC